MDQGGAPLVGSLTLQQVDASGTALKKTVFKTASFLLGRNEFRDIILKIEAGKKAFKFLIRDVTVHKKFIREGKATIILPSKNLQLMMSNCPPDQLIMFMKTLTTKYECLKLSGIVNERKRLLSELPRTFEDISPLNMKDLQTVHSARTKVAERDLQKSSGLQGNKRKRPGVEDQENIRPKGLKVARQQNGNITLSLSQTSSCSKPKLAVPVVLTAEQKHVLKAVTEGHSIFFTGSAGTGKSFLLRRIIGALPPQSTFATASTGVAACHIGGTTLHAFAGIGSGKGTIEQCVELASRPVIAAQWRKCKHLIIDEISMVDGDFFDKLEMVARVIRKNDSPFGGIQLIMCGDFLQLPPVTRGNDKRKFAFEAKQWDNCIERNFELTDVRRQSDKQFINILQNIRVGRCPADVGDTLRQTASHSIEKEGILATRLCTHKEDVDFINEQQLSKLKGTAHRFSAVDSDPALLKAINTMSPVHQNLDLKVGTQVMLAKNLDVSAGLVNGARGIIVEFENTVSGYPVVKFLCGTTVTIHPDRWSFKVAGGVVLTRRQLPLKLAWAISIHKSQGMSLDCVEISLSRVFETGQAYVALSRARSLEGLRVIDFSANCVRADPNVIRFYRRIRTASTQQSKQARLDNYYCTQLL